jgi:NADH-quinone oxidoreductase subunit E
VVVVVALQTAGVAEKTKELVAPWKGKKGGLIPILQSVQHEFGYLPEESLLTISTELKIPKADIYGVATFYAQFHLKPRGRHIIRVCRGTACHVRGSLKIMDKVKQILDVEENDTTEDLRFTLEPVACLGACGLAPVMMVDDETHGRLTPDKVQPILDKYE